MPPPAPELEPLQFYSHTTAAALWGIPLPSRATDGPLHVSAVAPSREPRTRGVSGHRLGIDPGLLTLVDGLPVAGPAETWAQLGWCLTRHPSTHHASFDNGFTAAPLLTADDLVIAADHLLHAGMADRADLETALTRVRRRGAVALAEAIGAARADAESPRETLTRLVIVRAGLPEPELNWTLRDALGRFVARLDMAYRRERVAVEYDGRQHAEPAQFTRDADRWAALEAEGWLLVRVLSHHFQHPQRDIADRVRRALRSRGWSPTR